MAMAARAEVASARAAGIRLLEPTGASGPRLVFLIERIAARDRAAFSTLYAATSAKLYGIILRILRRRELADEVLQEVYVQIWERAAYYDATKGAPITWMVAIARNRALDEVRRKSAVSIEDTPEVMNLAGEEEHPLDRVEKSQELARLSQCLDALESDRRELVLLAYREGMSRETLGQRFSRPPATIKSWLRRSLLQLRDCLDHDRTR
jgi:RNA polymerase sigma-70 factor, ECF subfamily